MFKVGLIAICVLVSGSAMAGGSKGKFKIDKVDNDGAKLYMQIQLKGERAEVVAVALDKTGQKTCNQSYQATVTRDPKNIHFIVLVPREGTYSSSESAKDFCKDEAGDVREALKDEEFIVAEDGLIAVNVNGNTATIDSDVFLQRY